MDEKRSGQRVLSGASSRHSIFRCAVAFLVAVSLASCGDHLVEASSVPVPDVVGLSRDRAAAELCASGLSPAQKPPPTADELAKAGQGGWTTTRPFRDGSQEVVGTKPAAGMLLPRGGEVLLRYRNPNDGTPLEGGGRC